LSLLRRHPIALALAALVVLSAQCGTAVAKVTLASGVYCWA